MSKDIVVAIVSSTDVTLVAPDAPEESTNYYSSGSKFHDDIPSIPSSLNILLANPFAAN